MTKKGILQSPVTVFCDTSQQRQEDGAEQTEKMHRMRLADLNPILEELATKAGSGCLVRW